MKIVNIVGARPNFMKIAPLIAAMGRFPDISQTLVHTGQHYDEKLSKVFFEALGIPKPDLNLEVGSASSREEHIEKIRAAFLPVFQEINPDLVLVVGDVNSTIACGGIAKENGCKLAHVEAGLRSFDESMPEELNRIATDHLSDFLFVTERSGLLNLKNENVPGEVYFVGNVMIDTLNHHLEASKSSTILADLGLEPSSYAVSTFHRPSNVDSRDDLLNLIEIIESISNDIKLVLPLHPRTSSSLEKHSLRERLDSLSNLVLTEPLGYLEFIRLVSKSRVVITDSGGIQEETTFLRLPCITMRENTERPSTIEEGTNTLVGSDRAKVLSALKLVLSGEYKAGLVPELWDGHAAERIVDILRKKL